MGVVGKLWGTVTLWLLCLRGWGRLLYGYLCLSVACHGGSSRTWPTAALLGVGVMTVFKTGLVQGAWICRLSNFCFQNVKKEGTEYPLKPSLEIYKTVKPLSLADLLKTQLKTSA